MAIPQLRAEGIDQGANNNGAFTVDFSSWTFQANDILELTFVTDGWIPVMTTSNGFQVAVASDGGVASVSTNGGVAGTNDCAIVTYWKRAVGTTSATDPPPVFQAPSVQSGTSWCLQPNSFSGARTSGTPYHSITTSIVSSAGTSVTSVAASSTLANCLFTPRVAAAIDDSAFSNWTMTGSAGPSGTKAPDTGWHNGTGNACCFTGSEGGFAAATSNVTGTTSFGASTPKQALVTLVMASLAEVAPALSWQPIIATPPGRRGLTAAMMAMSFAAPAQIPSAPAPPLSWAPSFPDFAPRQRAAPLTGGATAPIATIPDPAIPALSWLPSFPDSPRRPRAAPLASGAVAPVATIPDTAPPAMSWLPQFPDRVPRARTPQLASGLTAPVQVIPDAPAPALSWAPVFPDRIHTRRGAPLHSGAGMPAKVIPDASTAPTLGVAVWHQKANTTTPNTGTLTTRTVYPAWTALTAYQIIDDPRVANAGNTYECATSGTSAATGGPTGTPTPVTNGAIADGVGGTAARWNFKAAGDGNFDTQPSTLVLVSLGRGADASSGTAPRDNKGNTYSLIGSKTFFAGFPDSSAASWVSSIPATGGTGHTISADWGAGGDGGGDELSIMGVEVVGGTSVAAHSSIEATPVSNVCTSNPVTTTGPAVLVCFCWLNGTVQADGFLHSAAAGSGYTLLQLATGLLEIANGAGQVQGCTIARTVSSGGTYTATLITAGGEGAVMHLIAIQGSAVDVPSAASWIPKLPDLSPRARRPVIAGGAVAPVATLPDAPPLSWSPSFPALIPRARAAPIAGGPAAPVATLPDAPPLSWAPTFPDRIARPRQPIQGGHAGPVSALPDTSVPALSWAPAFPDLVPRTRAALLASGQVAPVATLPDQPLSSAWLPVYPPGPPPRARAAPLQGGSVAPVATLPDAPPLSWAPRFPDMLRRRAQEPAGGLVAPVQSIPDPGAPTLSWAPSFPDRITRPRSAPIVGGSAAPVATLPNPPAPALSWAPAFPDRTARARSAVLVGGMAAPFSGAINFAPPLVELSPIVTVTARDFLSSSVSARDILMVEVDNMTTPLDLTLLHGETRIIPITLSDPDTGIPVDLTSGKWQVSTIEYQIKPVIEGPDPPLLGKSLAAGSITLAAGSVADQIKILIDPADTPPIPVGRYVHDAVVLFASGARLYVIKPRGMRVGGVVNQL